MKEVKVSISDTMAGELEGILKELGYSSTEEFALDALEEKMLDLKRRKFFASTDRIREALESQGIQISEALAAFEKFRNENYNRSRC